jgi:hypothetical protein
VDLNNKLICIGDCIGGKGSGYFVIFSESAKYRYSCAIQKMYG